jgi:late competence protein required for DNA uptake (superfamily II DNA/RNA helicase)
MIYALYINHNSFSTHKHRFEKLRQARHKNRTLLFSSAIIGSS